MTKKIVAAKASTEVRNLFTPFCLRIKKTTRGNNAMPCAFVSMAKAKVTADNSGFDLIASSSEINRKKV